MWDGWTQAYASPGISYHHLPECGGNFSFLINYGGNSSFGCGAERHCYMQRGAAGGFLIDRPRHDEVTTTAAKPVDGAAGGAVIAPGLAWKTRGWTNTMRILQLSLCW